MVALMESAPTLIPDKLDQVAALPLGGRVKLNAWDNRVELIKTTPVAITAGRQDAVGSDSILPPADPLRSSRQPDRFCERGEPDSSQ